MSLSTKRAREIVRSAWAPSWFANTFRHAEFDRRDAERTGPLRVVAMCTASSARSMRGRCGCVERPGRLLSPENRPGRRDAPRWARCRRAAAPLGPDLAAVRHLVLFGKRDLPLKGH